MDEEEKKSQSSKGAGQEDHEDTRGSYSSPAKLNKILEQIQSDEGQSTAQNEAAQREEEQKMKEREEAAFNAEHTRVS